MNGRLFRSKPSTEKPPRQSQRLPLEHVSQRHVSFEDSEDSEDFKSLRIPDPEPDSKEAVKYEMLYEIDKSKGQHKAQSRHDVVKVGEDLDTYYNSVNILTGSQGSGKTFTALVEILGICRQTSNAHLLVFVSKKDYDPTFENIKALIEKANCRVEKIRYEDAEEFLYILYGFKALHNSIRRSRESHSEEFDIPEEIGEVEPDELDQIITNMYERLNVEGFDDPWLNTMVLFDDARGSSLVRKQDSYMNNRLRLCRDDNVIYFITIHSITSLPPLVKQNTAVVYLFKGLSEERQQVIFRQMTIPLDWSEFRGAYQTIVRTPDSRCMVVDNLEATWHVE
jgi:hypothetical protein